MATLFRSRFRVVSLESVVAASAGLWTAVQTFGQPAASMFILPLFHLIAHPLNLSPRAVAMSPQNRNRRGFTLVEILVVIVIIGILAAIAIPAISIAVTRAKTAAMKLELTGIDAAVEKYQEQFGDFPPDFSDYGVVLRHYRRIFPRMSNNDQMLLFNLLHDGAGVFQAAQMDRAEALVWTLNGYSDNPQRPFTGPGGPLVWVGDGTTNYTDTSVTDAERQTPVNFQISNDHPNALYEFTPDLLTVSTVNASLPLTGANRYVSTDDGDLFPTYQVDLEKGPFVYFDARTYDVFDQNVNLGAGDFNGYGSTTFGFVRPYRSNDVINNTGGAYTTLAEASRAWAFMNPESFQVVAPGIDGNFGVVDSADVNGGTNLPIYFVYPTGQAIALQAGSGITTPGDLLVNEVSGYQEATAFGGRENPQLDNVTNFSDAAIGDEVQQ